MQRTGLLLLVAAGLLVGACADPIGPSQGATGERGDSIPITASRPSPASMPVWAERHRGKNGNNDCDYAISW